MSTRTDIHKTLYVVFQRSVQSNTKNNEILNNNNFSNVELKYDTKAEYSSNRGVIQGICIDKKFGLKLLLNKILLTDVRFIISPECLLSFLLCEPLPDDANECIQIKGIDYYSKTKGNFKFRTVFNRKHEIIHKDTIVDDIKPQNYSKTFKIKRLNYGVVLYQPKLNKLSKTKIIEDIDRFTPVFQSADKKKYVFNCCVCGETAVNAQLRFIEQWITASLFGINIICCIKKNNKNFTQLQEFIDIVKHKHILEIMYRVLNAGDGGDYFKYIIEDIKKLKNLGESRYSVILNSVTGVPSYLWKWMKSWKDTVVSAVSGSSNDDSVTVSSTVESPVIQSSTSVSPQTTQQSSDVPSISLGPNQQNTTSTQQSTASSFNFFKRLFHPGVSSTQQNTSTMSTPPSLSTTISTINKTFPDNKIKNIMQLKNTFNEADIIRVLETCSDFALKKLAPIEKLNKKTYGAIYIPYHLCFHIFSKILLTKEFNDKINFDYWLVHWPERMKFIISFLLGIIDSNTTQHDKSFEIERVYIAKPTALDFKDTKLINPHVQHTERKEHNNTCVQVLCTYPHMRKDIFNSKTELSNTRFLLSPECLLTFCIVNH